MKRERRRGKWLISGVGGRGTGEDRYWSDKIGETSVLVPGVL